MVLKSERGKIFKAAMLKAARNEGHPLHNHFTWDEEEAARKWNEEEAGSVATQMRVLVDNETGE